MSVLNENTIIGASAAGGDYEIEQSLRFNKSDTASLMRTPSVASNQKTWTWSGWVKKCGAVNSGLFDARQTSTGQFTQLNFNSGHVLQFYTSMSGTDYSWESVPLYRDPSAWYHIVAVLNTPSSTQQDRFIVYVNGVRQENGNYYGALDQNVLGWVNSTESHSIGEATDGGHHLDGYLAEVNFIDGQALTPDSFGETGDYGEWKPKAYAGTYGTNGFYLKFENASSLGNDSAGSNNWTPTNLAATDQMVDSPTNNFCTFNPIDQRTATPLTYSEGNLKFNVVSLSQGRGTITTTVDGKFYFEFCTPSNVANTNVMHLGLSSMDIDINAANSLSGGAGGASVMTYFGGNDYWMAAVENGVDLGTIQIPGTKIAAGGIVGFAYDAATGKVWMSINNSWLKANGQFDGSNALSSTNFIKQFSAGIPLTPALMSAGFTGVMNCGQDSSFAGNKTPQGNQDSNAIGDFYYAPPTGFLALCTANLTSVDVIPSEHFNPVLYTGNGSTQSITGVGFQPDLVWGKSRSDTGWHALWDVVRGATKRIFSNETSAEYTTANSLTSFDSDGFSLGSHANNNANGQTYVAWNWKAGGSAVSNTNGTITSSVSANPAAGFSILTYTGTGAIAATIGHGLSSAPEMIIRKDRDTAVNWVVYHASLGTGNGNLALFLNTTSAQDGGQGFMNNTAPTSTVFTQGDQGFVGVSGRNYISYCFHSVDGHSKVGSYVGNGDENGPFVYCGFKPAWVMIKRTDNVSTWSILDSARDTFNSVEAALYADNTTVENDEPTLGRDYLSNGFKLTGTYSGINASGGTYIFLAFAESPFKHSNAR